MRATAALSIITLFLSTGALAADLTIRIDNIDKGAGQVLVALFDNAGSYLEQPLRSAATPALAGGVSVVFKDLAAGEYAFSVVHDANGNGKTDRTLFGIPTEKYAFSNNAVGRMGPASYADARFSVPAEGAAVTVRLR